MKAVIDTDIFVDILHQIPETKKSFLALWKNPGLLFSYRRSRAFNKKRM